MIKEVQNSEDVIGDDEPDESNTGISIVKTYNQRLREISKKLLADFRTHGPNNLPKY